ncbi:MAG TPA: bifunctional tetrahydrofolate synthase/dihydrofolate synthase [Chromatiales bacterium]|nr:bifunctional tetrahydrofolate synthase/dihydrofolate synthase [Thiotrichales bacterium]HIP67392.1 bifunctional tetrahydrofolate synthase/dihydrofolate synthase [Chromatiales bacterium]
MRFNQLKDWLEWQVSLHPREIDLGLERVGKVADQLGLLNPDFHIITVSGTNGKGSCVAMLRSIMQAAGVKTGCYTSPHIHLYNERININGEDVSDDEIMQAFERIDQARDAISLSYFEFATLAGLDLFSRAEIDVAILEVGLGGRLDAVNILDADIALVTHIAVDHVDWLGDDLDQIAAEKAGIARPGKPLICADHDPPSGLVKTANEMAAIFLKAGRDFNYQVTADGWDWEMGEVRFQQLPPPALSGKHQYQNAAAVLAVLQKMPVKLRPDREAIETGLQQVNLPGRWECVGKTPDVIFDVAHNPDSASVLAEQIQQSPVSGDTVLLLGVMRDKAVSEMIQALQPVVDKWVVSSPAIERALPANALQKKVKEIIPEVVVETYSDLSTAYRTEIGKLQKDDRLIVTGSFYTVAEVRALVL